MVGVTDYVTDAQHAKGLNYPTEEFGTGSENSSNLEDMKY
jgi:hypothetical protein